MLRIETCYETPREITYALAGQITEEHLPELAGLLAAALAAGRRVTLDLGAIVLVDRESVRFLVRGEGAAAALVHCPAYVLSWIRCEGGEEERKPS